MSAEPDSAPVRLAVLIPCFNEEATIASVVEEFRAALPLSDIYVFDNKSSDRSASRARGARAHVLEEPRRGKGHVLQSMFRTVDADVYILVDGDGTYPADAVQSLIEPILRGRLLFGISATDLLSGYRAFTRAVVQEVHLTSAGFQVDAEFTIRAVRARFRVAEVPVNLRRRRAGSHSKIRPSRDGLAIIRAMLALRRERPP